MCSFVHTDLKNADITFILACDRGVEVLSDRTARTRDCLTSALHPPNRGTDDADLWESIEVSYRKKGRADRRTVGDRSRVFLSEKSGFFVGKVGVFCRKSQGFLSGWVRAVNLSAEQAVFCQGRCCGTESGDVRVSRRPKVCPSLTVGVG